jgi:TonB family protein
MRRLAALLFLLLSPLMRAQTTQAGLEARLLHQPLYLRGFWHDDKLSFDSAGVLKGKSAPTSFTLSGIEITKLQMKSNRLILEGRRIGLTFADFAPLRVVLNIGKFDTPKDEDIQIEIVAPSSGDYSVALDAIFSDLNGISPDLPPWWQKYASHYLIPAPTPDPYHPPNSLKKLNVTPPKVLFAPEPQFSDYARVLKYSGNCLVYLQVDVDGKPRNLTILRPLGLGLDEKALLAVQAYRFKPAMEDGKPVRVEMNVEVNFQIF